MYVIYINIAPSEMDARCTKKTQLETDELTIRIKFFISNNKKRRERTGRKDYILQSHGLVINVMLIML